uniref:HMA domain-containing protein n=1 Tax=Oryza punctata TaxID=4537 RepID=A0A0E0K083_ORYPU
MGEEEKVKEEAAEKGKEAAVAEEKEEAAAAAGEEKKEDAPPPPPPPPEEVVMRVFMHCEGCARKVKKILRGFDGVEDVVADSKAHKVIVKGKKAAADPMKVVHRVQKKTGRKVELLSLMPPPEEKKEEEKKEEPEPPKPEEKEATVIAVVLKVHMHCEACAQVIRKKFLKMKGVQSAEPDMKASQVTVKGVFEESKLTDYVHKRIGKNAAVVKSEPVPPPEDAGHANAKDDKKVAEGGEKDESKEEKNEGDDAGGDEKEKEKEKDDSNAAEVEEKDKEKDPTAMAAANLYMHYPRFSNPGGYGVPGYAYPYAPQLFSDENPNACVVM